MGDQTPPCRRTPVSHAVVEIPAGQRAGAQLTRVRGTLGRLAMNRRSPVCRVLVHQVLVHQVPDHKVPLHKVSLHKVSLHKVSLRRMLAQRKVASRARGHWGQASRPVNPNFHQRSSLARA